MFDNINSTYYRQDTEYLHCLWPKNKKEGTRRTKGKDLIQNPITFSNKSGEKNKKKLHIKKTILNKLHWTTEDTNTRKVSKDIQQRCQAKLLPKAHWMKHHVQSVNSMVGMMVCRWSLAKMLCRNSNQGCGVVPWAENAFLWRNRDDWSILPM